MKITNGQIEVVCKSKRELMYDRITKHGENLKRLFNLPEDMDPVKLCKKLFTLEKQVNQVMCNLCNTNNVQGIEPGYIGRTWRQEESTEEEQEKCFDKFRSKLENIIGKHDFVFLNHDPRGYSLKIKEDTARQNNIYTDMGGYGIIAPDFSNK